MRRGVFNVIKIMSMALWLLAAGCALDNPLPEDYYATVRYHSGVASYLKGELRSAKTAIKLSINRVVDRTIIMDLNDAAARGIDIQVVVDVKNEESIAGLSSRVDVASGNANGQMQSNFAIIDDKAIFFSDYDITNSDTVAITIRQKDLISTLTTEFSQMHDNKAFGSTSSGGKAKQRINHQTVFSTSAGTVEMYFVPQNQALTYLRARMKQSRKSVDVFAKLYDNDELGVDFNDIAGSGLDYTFNCGNVGLSSSLRFPFLVSSDDNIITQCDLPCNAVFIDLGTPDETLLFTTFPFMSTAQLEASDGIVLFLRGTGVQQLKASLDYQLQIAPKYAGRGEGSVTSSIRVASFNVLNIGFDQKNYKELARVIADGGFDVVGCLEVSQIYPNTTPNAPAPDTLVGEHCTGRGLDDLCRNLNAHFAGDSTWSFYQSPVTAGLPGQSGPNVSTGLSGYREFYGYVWKDSKVSSYEPLGFYKGSLLGEDSTREFVRPPYAVRFYSGDADFTFVLQHAVFGDNMADRRREASGLYKVFEYFRDLPGNASGENILIGGDFNLPADDYAFAPLYTTVDRITWAIHPSTLTSLGSVDFSSAYDNIFYSQNRKRVLMTGRGAYKDWVTLTDYSSYGFTGENNFTYVGHYVADHVPVYITFDTSPVLPIEEP